LTPGIDVYRTPDDRFAGNGGLSLRRISAIKRVLEFQERYNDTSPEDEWFGARLVALPGIKIATAADASYLAVEDIWHENPMGYHVREGGRNLPDTVWKNQERRRKILEWCPEIKMVMEMKLERERCVGDDGEGNLDLEELRKYNERKEEERKKKEEVQKHKEEDEKRKKEEEERKKKEQKEKPEKQHSGRD
jgi:hypothetical protein